MAENNMTIFQRLTNLFGAEGPQAPKRSYSFDKKDILKTTSKADYDRTKLELQQGQYLANQWQKIESQLYSQAVYYEPTRLASYYDYESMEFTPEISAALDIVSEEACTISERGYMLNIYSESKRIKAILGDLFNNVLDIESNLPMWVRNTCKYGDNFVYLKIDPEKGIVGASQLPNIEIERIEKGMNTYQTNHTESEEREVKFIWKNKNMEFNTW